MKEIIIKRVKIGRGHPPFIVAEMSGNHNHSLKKALRIVEAAAESGANAIKLQTYTADTITIEDNRKEFFINEDKSLWKGYSLYNLYKKAYTPWEWHKPIFELCAKLGIIGFSTPFDASAVDYLEDLRVPCYKIASFENIDIPLIRKVAKTRKPVIISSGMAKLRELKEAIRTIRNCGCKDIVILKCTSAYPSLPVDSNLLTIPDMRKIFNCPVGISDHTLGIGVAVASVSLGACLIEKHVTLDKKDKGPDSAFSLEPEELKLLVNEARKAWEAQGRIKYGPTNDEKKLILFRRSLYAVNDIREGDIFTSKNIRSIRPGLGLAPKYYDLLLGKRSTRKIKKGEPLRWSMVQGVKNEK